MDRSLGSLQVLGTPGNDVIFTSYLDERVGVDTYSNTTNPSSGNWGGIVFRNNYDYDEQAADPARVILEQEGIFLNYVNHADIRYGGGKVAVNGIQDVYNPIHMPRPGPVSYNTIRYSADAAMSADPNSLLESTFHDRFGESPYAADYNRVGPDLHGNRMVSNTLNALFLRVETAAASAIQKLEVSARFDDVDIVLALPENLLIVGDAGGAIEVLGTCPLTADGRNQIVVPGPYMAFNWDTFEFDEINPFQDRQSFVIDDGVNAVRFEFDLSHGVYLVSIALALAAGSREAAIIIAEAINNSILNVTAAADATALYSMDAVDVRGLT